ncbi:MAG: sugar kinase [Clostridia bacterium]|nr:sugar kinase [Clostridia bacterium]
MERMTDHRIVLVTRKTRLDELIRRHNTPGQAGFYIEHHGGCFDDYVEEDRRYREALDTARGFLERYGRLMVLDRGFVPDFMFGERDIVVAIGRDGLVANTLKYLSSQPLIGVNPDPARWDGVLLPFCAGDLQRIVPETDKGLRKVRRVTLAEARLNDGQTICGVNDIFIGRRTHASARYELSVSGRTEAQSSSGIIVSTGLGRTGWLKSVLAGAAGIDKSFGITRGPELDESFTWESRSLYFAVREPYPSRSTGAELVFGRIEEGKPIAIASAMPENGVIFSDGMEEDCLEFNSGARATIGVAERQGNLVV